MHVMVTSRQCKNGSMILWNLHVLSTQIRLHTGQTSFNGLLQHEWTGVGFCHHGIRQDNCWIMTTTKDCTDYINNLYIYTMYLYNYIDISILYLCKPVCQYYRTYGLVHHLFPIVLAVSPLALEIAKLPS